MVKKVVQSQLSEVRNLKVTLKSVFMHSKIKKVLFVNDSQFEQDIQEIQCSGLVDVKKHVDFANSGMAALANVCATFERQCTFTYTLIIMDFDMPYMSGAQCAQMINRLFDTVKPEVNELFFRPNIVCLTSNNCKETLKQSIASGMSSQHDKPFPIEDLRRILVQHDVVDLGVSPGIRLGLSGNSKKFSVGQS